MTWLDFVKEGSKLTTQLSGDPNIKLVIDGKEIDISSIKFNLVKNNTKNYIDYQLMISN